MLGLSFAGHAQEPAKVFSLAQCRITSLPSLQTIEKIFLTPQTAVYVGTDGVVIGKSRLDDTVLWRTELGGNFFAGSLIDNSSLLIKFSAAGEKNSFQTYRLSTQNGISQLIPPQTKTSNDLNEDVTAADSKGFNIGKSFYSVKTNRFVRYDLNGEEIVSAQIKYTPEHIFKISDQIIAVSDRAGNFQTFDALTLKKLWKYRFGGSIGSLISDQDSAYIASLDGFVYKFDLMRGRISWKKRFDSRPLKIFFRTDAQTNSENIFLIQSGLYPARVLSKFDGQIIETFETEADEVILANLSDKEKIVTNRRLIDLESCHKKSGN